MRFSVSENTYIFFLKDIDFFPFFSAVDYLSAPSLSMHLTYNVHDDSTHINIKWLAETRECVCVCGGGGGGYL